MANISMTMTGSQWYYLGGGWLNGSRTLNITNNESRGIVVKSITCKLASGKGTTYGAGSGSYVPYTGNGASYNAYWKSGSTTTNTVTITDVKNAVSLGDATHYGSFARVTKDYTFTFSTPVKVGANQSVKFLLIFPSQWSSTAVTWYGSENAASYGNWRVSWEWDYTNATKPSISLSSSGTPASNITVTIKKGQDGTNNKITKTTYNGTYKIGSTSYSISSSFTGASKTFTIKNTDYGSVLDLSISATTVAQHNNVSCGKVTKKVGPVADVCKPPSVAINGKTTSDGNTDPNAYVKVTEAKETANNPIKSTTVTITKIVGSTTSKWSKTYAKGTLPDEIVVSNNQYDKKMTVKAVATTNPTYRTTSSSATKSFDVGPVFKEVRLPEVTLNQVGNNIRVHLEKGSDGYCNPYIKTEYLCLVSYGVEKDVTAKQYTKSYSGSFTETEKDFTITNTNIESGKYMYVSIKVRAVGTYSTTTWRDASLKSIVLDKVSNLKIVYTGSDRPLFFSTYSSSYNAISLPLDATDLQYKNTFTVTTKSGTTKTLSFNISSLSKSVTYEDFTNHILSEGSVISVTVTPFVTINGGIAYGPSSTSSSLTVEGNAWTKVKGVWHEGIVWIKVNGTWRKESSVITKRKGMWRN